MRKFTDEKKHRVLIICLIICIVLTLLNIVFSIRFGNTVVTVAGMPLQMNTMNGCIQTIIFIFVIGMVLVSPVSGLKLGILVILAAIFGSVRTIVMMHSLEPLPGTFSSLFFLVASIIFSRQVRIREKNAVTDDITGLCNGYEFEYQLHRHVVRSESGYLFFIHISGLGQISVDMGREASDEIMQIIANRIRALLSGKSEAYRTESAEFALIIAPEDKSDDLAENIVRTIEEPISLKKDDIITNCYVRAYVGESDFLNRDVPSQELIRRADIAMNYAIKSGVAKVCAFNDKMQEHIARELRIERLIKESLTNGYFYLVYQPQYTTSDSRLRGFETLIRMRLPNGDMISPGEFISVAEKSELILDIDAMVLRRAMLEFKDICAATENTLTVAVNVSAKNIARSDFADKLISLIDEVGFPAECLEIEITEYSFAGARSHTIENIKKLREKQVLIALDDFGTGYTSLEQLIKLPVNLVKLDKSLVDDVASSKHNTDFVKSVIYMGHLMDAEVIAEGVEYGYQLNMLEMLDCDFIQGFLKGRPQDYQVAKELALKAFS